MNSLQIRERWESWAEEFLKLQGTSMSDEITGVMINMTVSERNGVPLPREIVESFPYRVFETHARRIGLSITPYALAFMSLGVSKNPGTCVMYVHVLRYFQLQHNKSEVTMFDVCSEAFAFGFPVEDQLSKMWDKQKGKAGYGFDNMLDVVNIIG